MSGIPFLIFGVAIGFIFGFLVCYLRCIDIIKAVNLGKKIEIESLNRKFKKTLIKLKYSADNSFKDSNVFTKNIYNEIECWFPDETKK